MKSFKIKEIGTASLIVGILVSGSPSEGFTISQRNYISSFLSELGMDQTKDMFTPMAERENENPANDELLDDIQPYQHIIGKVMYAMTGTRPDIAFATSSLGGFTTRPTKGNMIAAKRLLCYLQTTKTMSISYSAVSGPLQLVGYADSDFASDPGDRKSVSGYLFTINGSPVSWSSQKQGCVATSFTETEYIAASHAAKEGIWLRRILAELGHPQNSPTIIREDNTGCIAMSKDPVFHKRTKHIDIHYHFV